LCFVPLIFYFFLFNLYFVFSGFYGVASDVWTERKSEYLPNRGVFLAPILSKGVNALLFVLSFVCNVFSFRLLGMNDKFGFYRGKILPNSAIATEFHNGTTETIYILSGIATGVIDGKGILFFFHLKYFHFLFFS
jgi:hypothetical protein